MRYYSQTVVNRKLLFLVVEHRQIKVDQFEVAGWSGVISSLEFAVESIGHLTNTCVDLHAHLGYFHLQNANIQRDIHDVI